MILEVRTYTAQSAARPHDGSTITRRTGCRRAEARLGRLVGFFTSELGPLNQIIHMWAL